MIIEEVPSKKGRFIIQEVNEVHDRRICKNPRHESISQCKKVFMTTHYKCIKNAMNKLASSLEYSSLVYDHSIGQWVNFDSIWDQHTILKGSGSSFGKIFQYLYDTGEDSSHIKSNEDISTIATTEKGLFKENSIKKPKSYNCLYQMQKQNNETLSCVTTESIQLKGLSYDERKKVPFYMGIIQEHSFTFLNQ